MKKLALILLLCIPSFIYATNDYLPTGTEIEGKYTVTATGETHRLSHYQTLPNVMAAVVIELDRLPDGEYYEIYLRYVSDEKDINWLVEPDGYKCYFNLDLASRSIRIEVTRRKNSSNQGIINVRTFSFFVPE